MTTLAAALLLAGLATAACAVDAPPPPPIFPDTVSVAFHPRDEDAIALEGVLTTPGDSTPARPGVILCHPHPLYGGTMNNPVVTGLQAALLRAGYVTLRFNFRGVGKSTGQFDGKGGEVQDVLGALDAFLARPEVDPKHVAIAGYSFGSWVGLQAAIREQTRVKCFAGVGFPIAPDTVDFGPAGFVRSAKLPMLFVSGSEDSISNTAKIERLLTLTDRIKYAKIVTLDGVDHFFGTQEAMQAMQETIVGWLKEKL